MFATNHYFTRLGQLKRFLLAGFLGLLSMQTKAQADLAQTELLLSPKFNYNVYKAPIQYGTRQGILQITHNPDQPPRQVIDSQGQSITVSTKPYRYGLDLGVRHTGQRGYGWSFLVGADWGKQFYSSLFSSRFSFNGYSINGWNVYLTYWQLNAGFAYYWPMTLGNQPSTKAFIRLNAHRSFNLQLIVPKQAVVTAYPINFTENGQGDRVELQNYSAHSLFVDPEIGLTLTKAIEVSASISIPLQVAFQEQHTFFQTNQAPVINTIDYRLGGVYLNARLLIPVKWFARRLPLLPSQPTYPTGPSAPYSRGQVVQLNNVYFKASSAALLPESYVELDKLTEQMRKHSTLKIRLEGHTDVIGDAKLNQELSEERVAAIQQYMASQGIDHRRIALKGYGDKRPLRRDCPPPMGCPENRRVEFVVTDN